MLILVEVQVAEVPVGAHAVVRAAVLAGDAEVEIDVQNKNRIFI